MLSKRQPMVSRCVIRKPMRSAKVTTDDWFDLVSIDSESRLLVIICASVPISRLLTVFRSWFSGLAISIVSLIGMCFSVLLCDCEIFANLHLKLYCSHCSRCGVSPATSASRPWTGCLTRVTPASSGVCRQTTGGFSPPRTTR